MSTAREELQSLLQGSDVSGMPTDEALRHLARLVDLACDLNDETALREGLVVAQGLQDHGLRPQLRATLNYYMANVWAGLRHALSAEDAAQWAWEQEEIEHEIVHLRRALLDGMKEPLPNGLTCSILTNLANLMNTIGRFVEAITYWDEALRRAPGFGMARGNRGYGLSCYAQWHYDRGEAAELLRTAYADLTVAVSSKVLSDARRGFQSRLAWIESGLTTEWLRASPDLNAAPAGLSRDELEYREWCLDKRLFLSPLNDLGAYWVASCDSLIAPPIVMPIEEGPKHYGFFNQLKQEFTSARYFCYEGTREGEPHFADRNVALENTLDYPVYCIAVERVKCAFRMAYSLLDKIAYFLNDYLELGIPERAVTFRSVWYEGQRKKNGLRHDFVKRENLPLRGLFWLSKDLYEDKPGFREAIEPVARELAEIRNHLEHKYLKLHGELAGVPNSDDGEELGLLVDSLAHSLFRDEFEDKTVHLLKTARAALIYLSLAIHCEENRRERARDPKKLIMPMPIDRWEDEWKR